MSAATFHADLRAGVRQRLLLLPNLPAVSWEGRDYGGGKGTPFLSETLVPVSSIVSATGFGGVIAHTVQASLTLHYPSLGGTTSIETMAGSLMEHFRPGTAVTYGSTAAVVQRVERMALMQEPDWINCPIVVTMIGHTTN